MSCASSCLALPGPLGLFLFLKTQMSECQLSATHSGHCHWEMWQETSVARDQPWLKRCQYRSILAHKLMLEELDPTRRKSLGHTVLFTNHQPYLPLWKLPETRACQGEAADLFHEPQSIPAQPVQNIGLTFLQLGATLAGHGAVLQMLIRTHAQEGTFYVLAGRLATHATQHLTLVHIWKMSPEQVRQRKGPREGRQGPEPHIQQLCMLGPSPEGPSMHWRAEVPWKLSSVPHFCDSQEGSIALSGCTLGEGSPMSTGGPPLSLK